MVEKLNSYGAQWLMEQVIDPPIWLVEDLIPTSSTTILASPPKFGKSIFCLQLGHCVANGLPFLDKKTTKAQVVYLCLEDQKYRLQKRLWALCDETTDDFRLVESAQTLGTGLIDQMEYFLVDFPETKLFIVDTLQITRDRGGDYSYANDYADLRLFKSFADKHEVACLIVHHLRKAQSPTDAFMDISGTTAISGAVDSMFVLNRESRESTDSVLAVTGRDIEYAEIVLRKNGMAWEFVEQLTEEEIRATKIPDEVKSVVSFVAEHGGYFQGSSSELIDLVGLTDTTPAKLGKQLSQYHEWMAEQGLLYSFQRTNKVRIITLIYSE